MTRPPRVSGPATLLARQAVRAALADLGPGTGLVVACSGGADSLALAVSVTHAAHDAGWSPRALVVDHGLRPGSAAEAAGVVAVLRGLGLPAEAVAVEAATGPGGPEGRAREARWAALRAHAGDDPVLTGHTMDDQAETVLLGLARGSGARSIAGMRPAEPGVRRPFLGLRRADTEAVCAELGLVPVSDPTNRADGPWRAADGSALRRAAVRERALPALADALGVDPVPALARTAEQARRDDDALTADADALLARAQTSPSVRFGEGPAGETSPSVRFEQGPVGETSPSVRFEQGPAGETSPSVRPGPPGADADLTDGSGPREAGPGVGQASPPGAAPDAGTTVSLDVAVLAAAHPALRSRALRAAGQRAGWRAGDVKAVHLERLDDLVVAYRGQGPAQLPGIVARRDCGRLILHPDQGATWT